MLQTEDTLKNPLDSQKPIPSVRSIVAVSSAKGGVGKSTLCTNLALSLSQEGQRVGILDGDIYGPSLPRMMGALGQRPPITKDQRLTPIQRHGIGLMSMGFLVEEETAVVWRGPMLFKAMEQLLFDVDWGGLDILLVDLPPGTGDVSLSLVQKVPVSGVVSVSTPQNMALADLKKSIDMFERLAVPQLGFVENMSFVPHPDKEGERISVFPKGNLHSFLKKKNISCVAEIPLLPEIAQCAEMGIPYTAQNHNTPAARAYQKGAQHIIQKITSSP